jgi:hypothetical protein
MIDKNSIMFGVRLDRSGFMCAVLRWHPQEKGEEKTIAWEKRKTRETTGRKNEAWLLFLRVK